MDYMYDSSGYDNGSAADLSDAEDYGDDASDVAGSRPQSTGRQSWSVIDSTRLAQVQDDALAAVMGILGCSRSIARMLLIHYRWNTENLFGTFAEAGQDRVFKTAGVTSRSSHTPTATVLEGEVSCACCFCDVAAEEATSMECGHAFCNICWAQHFRVQIQEGNSRRLKCMGEKCGAICDEDKVKQLIANDIELLAKFESKLLASYIEDNNLARWCPSVPHCGNAIRVESEPYCEPVCSCGLKFCFNCCEAPHSPCTCDMWRRWKQKCQDDSETKNWLTANTKPCPKCLKAVEKNGGCNLVTCVCGQSFCWLCGASTGRSHTWTEIAGHSCGRYKEEVDRKIDEAQRNVKRYMHYHSRWEAHMNSQKLEDEQKTKLLAKINVLEQSTSTLKDYAWLSQGLEQLFEARRILGYTYAFAFFMFGNDLFRDEICKEQNTINQNLFESQQQELESQVERLSLMMEMPPEKMEEVEDLLRLDVINSTVNVDKRLEKLYELIENDLLGNLMFSPNYISPYKGASALKASAEGSPKARPASAHIIDLTNSPTPSPGSRSPGKRPRLAWT